MEVVRVFNSELTSLYETKPPVSKAKMTQVTKCAIKGIKFYKHIVQSVEKFIQKCKPEYKIPGLYVVDSIVRQSRHQFGADKDLFGPRFTKNITSTFQHLFKCSEEDRPKIVRVLNLWQKNAVFPIEVVQPLLDMANPNTAPEWPLDIPATTTNEISTHKSMSHEDTQNTRHKSDSNSWKGWTQSNVEPINENRTYAEMSTKNLEKFSKSQMSGFFDDEVPQTSPLKSHSKNEAKPAEENAVKFNKKLLDFDYGDEDDDEEVKNEDNHLSNEPNALALSMAQNLLSNPELLRQLQQMQQTIQQSEALKALHGEQGQRPSPEKNELCYSTIASSSPPPSIVSTAAASFTQPVLDLPNNTDKDDRVIPEPPLPSMDLDERSLASIIPPPERVLPTMAYTEPPMHPFQFDKSITYPPQQPEPPLDPMYSQNSHVDEDERVMYSMPGEPPLPPQDFDERPLVGPEERGRKERSRSRSGERNRNRSNRHRSGSRSPRRRRSRSRSPHSRRARSRSRDRGRDRIREKERERERERERRKKGIPFIKNGCITVCSTTIWLGHVPKACTEADISDIFGEYGTIQSIDMIPPRGCAYVVMDRRQDGYRALQKLKNLKIQGSPIKISWAPGKGMKGKEFKDYWDMNQGVSYVPYDKIRDDAECLDLLEDGGVIDEDSLPEHLRALRQSKTNDKQQFAMKLNQDPTVPFGDMQVAPGMVPPPMMPPTSVTLPMVMPHLMQPQFGLHMPGMIPPQPMVMQVPMGIPPPNPVMMVPQTSQNMPMQMASRSAPPVPLQTMKPMPHPEPGLASPGLGAPNDATPTEDDNMNMSPVLSNPETNTPPFRPMVATSGAPIPYPPPNVGFGFPPPGIRPGVPWIQKAPDSNAGNASPMRPPVPPFGNRMPEPHEGKRNSIDREPHFEKMGPNTDDESSMDREYQRGAPRFAAPFEMQWRFQQHGFGPRYPPPEAQFAPRMGGPRMDYSMRRPRPNMHEEMMPPEWFPEFEEPPPPFEGDHNQFVLPPQQQEHPQRGLPRKPEPIPERPPPQPVAVPEKKEPEPPKPKPKPAAKPISKEAMLNDLFKLQFYVRDKKAPIMSQKRIEKQMQRVEQEKQKKEQKPDDDDQKQTTENKETLDLPTAASEPTDLSEPEQPAANTRKRSRWGRTLSEEREFQQQKRTEIELKFQNFENLQSETKLEVPPDEPEVPPDEPEVPPDEPEVPPNEPEVTPDEPEVTPDEPILPVNTETVTEEPVDVPQETSDDVLADSTPSTEDTPTVPSNDIAASAEN